MHATSRTAPLRRLFDGLILVGSLWLAMACNPTLAPVHAPRSSAGLNPKGVAYSADQIQAAVVAGLAAKRWTLISMAPGQVEAEVSAGGHSAKIRVEYDAQGWDIQRVSSSPGLRYNPHHDRGQVIHRRYNNWINLLDKAIRKNLGVAPPVPSTEPAAPTEDPGPAPDPGATELEPEPEPDADDYM